MNEDRHQKTRVLEELLILDAKRGDRWALNRLIELRGPRLHAHAARLSGDREAARDIVQEAWIQIIRALPSLRQERAFLPWALCIVSRRVAAHIKDRQKGRKLSQAYAAEVEVTPETPEPGGLETDAILAALKKLPPAQQATVALFYLEDLRVSEVATALNVPVGTVKTRLMKARETLRDLLEGEANG
jgi:RNA polymerase sigma-70 factor (ECF subfamily)